MASKAKYDKDALRKRLLERARFVAGEVTSTFFDTVSDLAPVEEGHIHETFGKGLQDVSVDLPEVNDTASKMLSKGSGDAEAASRGWGKYQTLTRKVKVSIGTKVGFVKKLDDGETITPGDARGRQGRKEPGTEGQLYGPRTDQGKGFLMWQDATGKHFALSVNWGPMGFFEQAAEAARVKANSLGAN